jgi:tetratricopeptide (TPR) repeat protein
VHVLVVCIVGLLQVQTPEGPRDIVRHAAAGVGGDSVAVLRRRWEKAVRAPGGDRLAALGMATLAELTYDSMAADSLLKRLLPAPGHPPDAISVRARLGLAQLARSRGRFPEAETLLTLAREEADSVGDREAGVEALLLLAVTRGRTAGPRAAEALFAQAAPSVGADPFLGALYHCGRADVAVLDSRPARDDADRGAELAALAGDDRIRSACLGARAADRAREGDVDGALADMGAAADLARRRHDFAGLSTALQWRGFWLRSIGWLERARRELEEALEAGRVAGADPPRAWAYANLAFIDLAVGDARSGAAHADSADALFAAQGDRYGEGTLAGVRADLAFLTGDLEGAEAAYRQEIEIAQPLNFGVALVTARIGLAHVAISRRSWAEADRQLEAARAVAAAAGMRGRLQGLAYHRGVLDLDRGRLDAAEAELSAALRQLEAAWRDDPAGGQPDRVYHYRMRLAEIRAIRHDPEGAATLAAQAMDGLEAWRATLSRPELRVLAFQVSEDRSDPDLGFASIVAELVREGRAETAFGLAERLRVRSLQDQRMRLEAVGGADPGGSSLDGAPPVVGVTSKEMVASVPDEGTALLEWVTGRGGEPTTLFIVGRFGLLARVLAPADSIEPAVRRLNALMASGDWAESLARTLTEDVLGDAPALLPAQVRHLVVVPDGPLHLVPFNALVLKDGALLVDRFALAEATSGSAAALRWRSAPVAVRGSVLAFGDPRLPAGVATGLPALPGAAAEARWAAGYGVGSGALLGADASEARLKALPPGRYGVLHFATHSRLDETTLAGVALLLSPGGGQDGVVGAGELAGLRLDAGVAVLSGCSTASGRIVRGEGVVGLASALRAAGVRAVVLTRWPLEDRAGGELIHGLYRGLSEGLPVSEAARAATLEARSRGAPPSVWATLTVVGDERLAVPLRPPGRRAPLVLVALTVLTGLLMVAYRRRRGGRGPALRAEVAPTLSAR